MKKLSLLLVAFVALFAGGCEERATGEDVNAKLKARPAQEQFDDIKNEAYLSLPMKEKAVDALPVDDGRKQKWKEELRQAASGGSQTPSRPQ